MLAPLIVGGVILALWQLHPANTVVVIPMIAMFELALNGDRRRSLWMSVALVPCVVISVVPFASGFSHITSIVVRNIALVLLAIAAGEVLRSRRVSEQRLVQTAEQTTLRRVGEERLRIAREIHDVVAHAMTAINVQAGVAAHLLERDPGQAYDALRNIKHTSGAALTDLRSTLEVLRDPSSSAPLGPPAGLGDIAELTGGLRSARGDRDARRRQRRRRARSGAERRPTGSCRRPSPTSPATRRRRPRRSACAGSPGAIAVDVTDDGAAPAHEVTGETLGNGVRGHARAGRRAGREPRGGPRRRRRLAGARVAADEHARVQRRARHRRRARGGELRR